MMIPLHLAGTTVHVSRAQADRLVALQAAEWLPGVLALRSLRSADRDVLAVLSA